MAITDDQIKQKILAEVGDSTPPSVQPMIDLVWLSYADKSAVSPRLQELYTKRDCIDIRLNSLSDRTDFTMDGALSLRLSQREGYLTRRRAETCNEIEKWERIARANRPGAVAPLAGSTVQSVPPPDPTPGDAGSPLYQGSPYFSGSPVDGI